MEKIIPNSLFPYSIKKKKEKKKKKLNIRKQIEKYKKTCWETW
jgi:hypothetical protein